MVSLPHLILILLEYENQLLHAFSLSLLPPFTLHNPLQSQFDQDTRCRGICPGRGSEGEPESGEARVSTGMVSGEVAVPERMICTSHGKKNIPLNTGSS